MSNPDKSLVPDWDEDNINHIAEHGLSPEQVEEVYTAKGHSVPWPLSRRKNMGNLQNIDTGCGGQTPPGPVLR